MNVIVSNKNAGLLESLDVEIIKTINGEFTADEIIGTFSNFFFNRMFLDITALKDYTNISNIQKLSINLDMDKVIFLLDNKLMSDTSFLSKLISMGIYNFANNKESLMYLYDHPNTYKDVAHIHQLNNTTDSNDGSNNEPYPSINVRKAKVIGFKKQKAGDKIIKKEYNLKSFGYKRPNK